MRRHIGNAFWAAMITAVSAWGLFAQIGHVTPTRVFASIVALPLVPGIIVTSLVGMGHGPSGMPNHGDAGIYVFTFLIWWALIEFGPKWWRRLKRATGGRTPD